MPNNKKRMGRPKKPEPSAPLRIPLSIVRRIRRAAHHSGMEPGEFVAAEIAKSLERVETQIAKELERMKKQRGEERHVANPS
jgi:hypothetical protein